MTITDLFIYPVKSLGGIRVQQARVTARGLEHDRRWMVVRQDGGFVTQRQLPALARITTTLIDDSIELRGDGNDAVRLPLRAPARSDRIEVTVFRDNVVAVRAPAGASEWLSDQVGEHLELVWMPDDSDRAPDPAFADATDRVSFADGYPVLLTGTASLAELNDSLDEAVPMTRFRPNVVVPTVRAWQEETWRSVTIGQAAFHVAKPCGRCVVTTVPQLLDDVPPIEDRSEPLRTLARIHSVNGKAVFGVNLIPRSEGVLRVGDAVRAGGSVMGA